MESASVYNRASQWLCFSNTPKNNDMSNSELTESRIFMGEFCLTKLVLKLLVIIFFFYWFIYCRNKYKLIHWGGHIKIMLEWIITYIQACLNYVKIYLSHMYALRLVKHVGFLWVTSNFLISTDGWWNS